MLVQFVVRHVARRDTGHGIVHHCRPNVIAILVRNVNDDSASDQLSMTMDSWALVIRLTDG